MIATNTASLTYSDWKAIPRHESRSFLVRQVPPRSLGSRLTLARNITFYFHIPT